MPLHFSFCPDASGHNFGFNRMKEQIVHKPQKGRTHESIPSANSVVKRRSEMGVEMVFVKGGTFRMGDILREGRKNEKPPHKVSISDFWMGETAVTFQQFEAFCIDEKDGKLPIDQGWGRGRRPVINVTWHDAIDYCNWLSKKERFIPAYKITTVLKGTNPENGEEIYEREVEYNLQSNGYRLPTEAEWEYAARSPDPSLYTHFVQFYKLTIDRKVRFGNGLNDASRADINFSKKKESAGKTVEVDALDKCTNALGLKHMSGNVWEWCWDWFSPTWYDDTDQEKDPVGPSTGVTRCCRGGSWADLKKHTRATYRGNFFPEDKSSTIGFRLVRPVILSSTHIEHPASRSTKSLSQSLATITKSITMPKTFISHKSQQKSIAIKIKAHLEKCFIACWLDKDDLVGGQDLNEAFLQGIGGRKTIALISEEYIDSEYCRKEFGWAFNKDQESIIPILLDDHSTLLRKAKEAKFIKLVEVLEHNLGIPYDKYDPKDALRAIERAVNKDEAVWFSPIVEKTVDGQALQEIKIETQPGKDIPRTLFQTWDVYLEIFMADADHDDKPIKRHLPVAISGRGPNWLYCYLVMPFQNHREVFIFNQTTSEYVCVYARRGQEKLLGRVLKESVPPTPHS